MAFNPKFLKANEIRSRIDNDLDLPIAIKQTYISGTDSLAVVEGAGYFLNPVTNGQIYVSDVITIVTGTESAPVSTIGTISSVGTFTETV